MAFSAAIMLGDRGRVVRGGRPLLSAVNQLIIVILKNIEDPGLRACMAERFIEHFPRLVEAAEPGYRLARQ